MVSAEMIRLRLGSLLLEWEFSFFAVLGLLLAMEQQREAFYASVAAILLHESGHLVTMQLLGQRVRQVTFRGCGIRILPEHCCYSYGQDFLVLLTGPCSNLLCCLVLWQHCGSHAVTESTVFWANLVLGGMNLLPCRHLDGGAMVRCILGQSGCDVQRLEGMLRLIACGLLILLGIAGVCCGIRNVSAYAMLLALFCMEVLS